MKKISLNQIVKLLTLILTVGIFFTACQKEKDLLESDYKQEEITLQNNQKQDGAIRLGRKLENPYSVANMRKAYANLTKTEKTDDLNIVATHLYMRYLPANEQELTNLKNDSLLVLFDYPLDYEIGEGGVSYHDPELPETSITWQYCVVKPDYQFLPIQYEVIEELFIPELLEETNKSINTELEKALVKEALMLTGNWKEKTSKAWWNNWNWHPSGKIRVFDDILQTFIPLEGVKVRAVNWFVIKEDYTDANGNYEIGAFKGDVNYSIKWETNKYDIRDGNLVQAYFNGPNNKKSAWDLDINSGKSIRFATIHRAAYRYQYKDIGGLKRPSTIWKLKYCYYHRDRLGEDIFGIFLGNILPVFPDIKIYGSVNSLWMNTEQIFSTTIHETAHASHTDLLRYSDLDISLSVDDVITESWARAVQWYIGTIDRDELAGKGFSVGAYNARLASRMVQTSVTGNYTCLFIDMVDGVNQALIGNSVSIPENRCPNGGVFDGTNCFVGTPPIGENAFIWDEKFYYTPVGVNGCPLPNSSFDNVNCKLMDIPTDAIGSVWNFNNSWYLTPAGRTDRVNDYVTGYTMPQLEGLLKNIYKLSDVPSKLKINKSTGITNKHIDVYFNSFNILR